MYNGQGTEHVGVAAPQEAIAPFEGVDDTELIDRYYETECDPDIGRELSIRILRKVGFEGDPGSTPLIGSDRTPILGSDGPLMLADYVNFAAKHHLYALEGILGFLMMEQDTEGFEAMRTSILARLGAGST